MDGIGHWRRLGQVLLIAVLALFLAFSPFNQAVAEAAHKGAVPKNELPKANVNMGGVAETSPPQAIQELREALEVYQPQVTIVTPKSDEVISDNTVSVRFQVKDLPVFKDEKLGLGPHLHVFLDNRPYQAVYDLDKPFILENLEPGTHSLRVFASRPWHESFKNEGAYAQTTFHVFTKTKENAPNPDLPLLTYSRPQGSYGAEPIMLDFYLINAPLHLVAQENPKDDIADWRIRCTINGNSFVLDRWQPIYLKGFKPGKNWVQLEFLDDKGNPVSNAFNNTARVITYDPNGSDTLAKLVRGDLSAKAARGIVDPNYVPEPPTPLPSPTPLPAPAPSAGAKAEPKPEAKPTPTPEASPLPIVPPVRPTPSPELKVVEPSPEPKPVAKPKLKAEPTPSSKPKSVAKPKQVRPEPTPGLTPIAKPTITEPSPVPVPSPEPAPSVSPEGSLPKTTQPPAKPPKTEPPLPVPELTKPAPTPPGTDKPKLPGFVDRLRQSLKTTSPTPVAPPPTPQPSSSPSSTPNPLPSTPSSPSTPSPGDRRPPTAKPEQLSPPTVAPKRVTPKLEATPRPVPTPSPVPTSTVKPEVPEAPPTPSAASVETPTVSPKTVKKPTASEFYERLRRSREPSTVAPSPTSTPDSIKSVESLEKVASPAK